jgi:hypothetical protein
MKMPSAFTAQIPGVTATATTFRDLVGGVGPIKALASAGGDPGL